MFGGKSQLSRSVFWKVRGGICVSDVTGSSSFTKIWLSLLDRVTFQPSLEASFVVLYVTFVIFFYSIEVMCLLQNSKEMKKVITLNIG